MSTKQARPQLTLEERELRRARRDAEAAETQARRWRDAARRWEDEGLRMTRAEFEAGEPCRGCGLPIRDGLGDFPPLLHMTDEERTLYDAEEARYKERHCDCHGGRWSVSGSRTLHCTMCCPFPPMSKQQVEDIARLLGGPPPSPASLMVWELTLTCGHVTRRQAHIENYRYGSTTDCEECGGEVRGVVAQVKIGTAEEAARENEAAATAAGSTAAPSRQPKRPSMQAVRRKLREAEAQAAALRIQLAEMKKAPPQG